MATIEVTAEGQSMAEARERLLASPVPQGHRLLRIVTVSDGRAKEDRAWARAKASTLAEARRAAEAQIPQGAKIGHINKSDAGSVVVRGEGNTVDEARVDAENRARRDDCFVSMEAHHVIDGPLAITERIEAANEYQGFRSLADRIGAGRALFSSTTIRPERKGLFGLFRRSALYEIRLTQKALVEITYQRNAEMAIMWEKVTTPQSQVVLKATYGTADESYEFEPAGYSYARDRLQSHMKMPKGPEMTMEILDDVVRVIDEYAYRAGRNVGPYDFIELTQALANAKAMGLSRVRSVEKEIGLLRPVLAGLRKLVMERDLRLPDGAIPNDVEDLLNVTGPKAVDAVVEYLAQEFQR